MSEYCKYSGTSTRDARTLLNGWCPKHPSGPSRGRRKIKMEKQSFKVVLGRDEQGGDIAFDLATLPHLLIGGSTAMAFPGRITFKMAFEEDARMIIGENGADRLNGKGDFLFRDSTGLHRGQVPYISDEDFESLCAR